MSCAKEKCSVCSWETPVRASQILAIYAIGRQGVDLEMCETCEKDYEVANAAARRKYPKSAVQRAVEEMFRS